MKILAIHKHYFRRDGASTYFLDVNELLTKNGHEVVPFSMKHKKNLKTKYSSFFAPEISFRSTKNALKKAVKFVHNKTAVQKLEKLIAKHGPFDVAHVHNVYHHLTPSILGVLKAHKIPMVMTLHDYKLVNADYTLVRKRTIAEKTLESMERLFHSLKGSYKAVDKFLAPSKFMQKFCVAAGWPKDKFVHLPYVVDAKTFAYTTKDGGYVAYAGRLSHEKGLKTLLAAAVRMSDTVFKIAGSGPEESALKRFAKQKGLNNVEFLGFLGKAEVKELIGQARVAVVPSEWFENYPFSVLEAMSMGTVVVASNIGGIPEQIKHGVTGFLFTPRNVESLVKVLGQAMELPTKQSTAIGLAAREFVVSKHSSEVHYERLMKVYEQVAS